MTIDASLLRTPLHTAHLEAGGRMVPFAGWEMPVYYGGINREVLAVRQRSGIFDVSHMGRLEISGTGANELLQRLTANDINALAPGAGQYSLMLRPDGGILDDLIVYRRSDHSFLAIVNASNRGKILAWIRDHASTAVAIRDTTLETALIALQGPDMAKVADELGLKGLPRKFHLERSYLGGIECEVSRTGYTGEDGIEVITRSADAPLIWSRMTEAGAEPCGLGARDTLRLEAAYCLYGHEIDEMTNPLQAGLGWVVKLDRGDFIGREALIAIKEAGLPEVLTGIIMEERSVPRQGQHVYVNGEKMGRVTSGTYSPTLQKSIALAYLQRAANAAGAGVSVENTGRTRAGVLMSLPFYRSSKAKS